MIRRFYEKYFKGDIIRMAKIRLNRENQLGLTREAFKRNPNSDYIKLQEVVFMLTDVTAPSFELFKELQN